MEYFIMKYIYYLLLLSGIIYADKIIDHNYKRSRILRLIIFLSPWLLLLIMNIQIDLITTTFLFLATLGAIIISIYSEGYLKILFGKISALQIIIDVSLLFLIMFFLSYKLVEFIILWIIVELMGTLLIMLERGMRNFNTVIKYLIICVTAGDISLFILLALPVIHIGFDKALTLDLSQLSMLNITLSPLLTILVLIGFTTKLAQIPLHIWLAETYTETPSPGTAIFSGLMSKMAIYAILRIYDLLHLDITTYTYLLIIQGMLTALYGFFSASIHNDLKKIMSYSSMGHYGISSIILALIPYNKQVLTNLILAYVIYHGLVKIQAFLNIASIELLANTRDIYRLGYLAQVARKIYNYSIITFSSLIGIPPTIGFLVKFALLVILFEMISTIPFLAIGAIICISFTTVFSIIYSVKYISVYTSMYSSKPVKTTIKLTNPQTFSEVLASCSAIVLTPFFIFINTNTFINIIILIIYSLSLVSLVLTILFKNKVRRREEKTWVGGIEI